MNITLVASLAKKVMHAAGGVDGASAPPPAPSSGLPDAPIMLETTGSLVGQLTLMFWKPNFLQGTDNTPIASAPVTSTTVYVSSSWANAEAGVFTYSGNAGTTEQVTISGIAAGTWYVTAVCTNANGAGDRSHILVVTVT